MLALEIDTSSLPDLNDGPPCELQGCDSDLHASWLARNTFCGCQMLLCSLCAAPDIDLLYRHGKAIGEFRCRYCNACAEGMVQEMFTMVPL